MSAFQTLYNLTLAVPSPEGETRAEVAKIIASNKTTNGFAMMALPLKLAGTFLREAVITCLRKHYSADLHRGSWSSIDQDRDLYFPAYLNMFVSKYDRPHNKVTHCHVHGTRPNTAIIELFKIPTLLGSRDIFDNLVSLHDNVNNPKAPGDRLASGFVMQTGTAYEDMTEEERHFQLVSVAPFWFSRYYRTWIEYTEHCNKVGKQAPMWMRFTDIKEDPYGTLSKVMKHLDPRHSYSDAEIKSAYDKALGDKANLRFNKGVGGRGEGYFTAEEKAHIRKIMCGTAAFEEKLIEYGVLPPR